MEATFRAKGAFTIESKGRRLFVIHGDIMDGTVRVGMVARLSGGSGLLFSEITHGVGFLDYRSAREAEVALTFESSGHEQLAAWQQIDFGGQVLVISDAADGI